MKIRSLARRSAWIASALAMTVATAGLLAAPASAQPTADTPLVIARNIDINSLDPARTGCDTCTIYLDAIYETLIRLAPDGKTLVPNLAESWEPNADNTSFTFHLNPAAVFADASPVEAKDVKWSWERLINAQGSLAYFLETIDTIETPDDKTVVVKLKQSDAEFLGKVAAVFSGVVNSDLAAENGALATVDGAPQDTAESWFLSHSAGSGPYVLANYSPNDELRFKRNENYWAKPAAIDEIVIRQTKDAIAQAQALQAGDADIAMQIAPDTAKTINSPDITIETVPSFNMIYLALSPGAKAVTTPLTPNVRKAIGLAIDYKGIVDFVAGGGAQLQASPLPNGFPGTEGLPMPVQDVEQAKTLLVGEGLADGFDLEATFPNENFYGVDMATLLQKIQQDLAKVNIRLQLKPVTFPVFLDTVNGDGTPLTASYYAPDYYGSGQYVSVFAMMDGTRWYKRAGGARVEGVANPREKDLLDKALAAPAEEQVGLYHDLGQEMINDRVIIPLLSPDNVLAYNKNVTGMDFCMCLLSLQGLAWAK